MQQHIKLGASGVAVVVFPIAAATGAVVQQDVGDADGTLL